LGLHAEPAPSRAELIVRLLRLMPRVRRQFQARLPADVGDELAGVTPHQFEALHMLHHLRGDGDAAEGTTMNELARHQQCALSTATALVDRLIRQGLAERSSDPEDRRVVRIALTTRGERLLRRFTDAKHAFMVEALTPLSDAELTTLLRLFDKVAAVVPATTPRVHAMELGDD
jgi:DNA-binding MarR family transcriptional regulator